MPTYIPTEQGPAATDIEISFGIFTMKFDLVPIGRTNKAKDTALVMVCPEPHPGGPVKGKQQYVCPDGHTYTAGTAAKAREVDKKLVIVDKDAVKAAKAGGTEVETRTMPITMHPADEVAAVCRPGAKGYRLRPARGRSDNITSSDLELYAVLAAAVAAHPESVLVGELVLKGRGFYRLEVWDGQLILSELVLPSGLAARDQIDVPVDPETIDAIWELAEKRAKPWDPDLYGYNAAAALDELARATAEGGDEAGLASVTSIAPVKDVGSFLKQLVADARQSA